MSEADEMIDGGWYADRDYNTEKIENQRMQLDQQQKFILKQKEKIKQQEKQLTELKAENFELVNRVDVLESEKENLMRTLEEGSEELEEVKAENKLHKEQLIDKDIEMHASFVSNDKLCDKNHNLIHQLKEKDDKIKNLEATHYYRFDFRDKMCQEVVISDEMLKIIIHQVRNKIMEQITAHTGMAYHKGQKSISLTRLDKIFNKIEKGEL